MNCNDVLRSIRYTLSLSEQKICDIINAAGVGTTPAQVASWLLAEDEAGYAECDDAALSAFLDGVIVLRRGPREAKPGQAASSAPVSTRLNNNLVLKKLRIAFELKEEDLLEIFALAQFRISRPEVTALFRAPGHQNYRVCGDQILRNFLKGLAARVRRPKDSKGA